MSGELIEDPLRTKNGQRWRRNMLILRKAWLKQGLRWTWTNQGQTICFREPNAPRVDFFPSTGKWMVCGARGVTMGDAKKFLGWYYAQKNKMLRHREFLELQDRELNQDNPYHEHYRPPF